MLCRRIAAVGSTQPPGVVPVDVLGGGQLDVGEPAPVGLGNAIRVYCGQSGSDVVLVGLRPSVSTWRGCRLRLPGVPLSRARQRQQDK
jgi:hypothetical protein